MQEEKERFSAVSGALSLKTVSLLKQEISFFPTVQWQPPSVTEVMPWLLLLPVISVETEATDVVK